MLQDRTPYLFYLPQRQGTPAGRYTRSAPASYGRLVWSPIRLRSIAQSIYRFLIVLSLLLLLFRFVHTNIDADVIVWEGNRLDPYQRPPEAYSLVENLCMGTRRLDLFGTRPRRGWVTVNFSDLLPHGDDEEGAERTTLEELEKKVSGETLAEAEPEGRWTEFDPDTYEGLTSINGQHVVPVTAGEQEPSSLSSLSL
jgi:hypothetical protein